MRRAVASAALVAVVVALAPVPALAVATAELAKARAEYARSQYERCVAILVPVMSDPRQMADLSDEDSIEAHKLLGLAYFFLSQKATVDDKPKLLENAGIQFASLLFIDPDYVLDAAVEGPEATQYFDAIKRDQQQQLAKIREQKRKDEERKRRPQRERLVLTVQHDESGLPNFIPFGYGQFRNGQARKGAILGVIQGAAFATSAILYVQHSFRYGWPVGRLPADPDEVDSIRNEQYLQIGAGSLFFLAYAYSVWDGYKHQRPAVITKEEIRPIQYDDGDSDSDSNTDRNRTNTSSADPKSALTFLPLFTGDALGLGAAWEF